MTVSLFGPNREELVAGAVAANQRFVDLLTRDAVYPPSDLFRDKAQVSLAAATLSPTPARAETAIGREGPFMIISGWSLIDRSGGGLMSSAINTHSPVKHSGFLFCGVDCDGDTLSPTPTYRAEDLPLLKSHLNEIAELLELTVMPTTKCSLEGTAGDSSRNQRLVLERAFENDYTYGENKFASREYVLLTNKQTVSDPTLVDNICRQVDLRQKTEETRTRVAELMSAIQKLQETGAAACSSAATAFRDEKQQKFEDLRSRLNTQLTRFGFDSSSKYKEEVDIQKALPEVTTETSQADFKAAIKQLEGELNSIAQRYSINAKFNLCIVTTSDHPDSSEDPSWYSPTKDCFNLTFPTTGKMAVFLEFSEIGISEPGITSMENVSEAQVVSFLGEVLAKLSMPSNGEVARVQTHK